MAQKVFFQENVRNFEWIGLYWFGVPDRSIWYYLQLENAEEKSLCNKEIVWSTKVYYLTGWGSLPQNKFCYQLSQWKCPGFYQKGKLAS